VVVVEHDPEIIREADHIIDLGPQAGERGGEVMFTGRYTDLLAKRGSATGAYLAGRRRIPVPAARRRVLDDLTLAVRGATATTCTTSP